jgi:hypothetical protein
MDRFEIVFFMILSIPMFSVSVLPTMQIGIRASAIFFANSPEPKVETAIEEERLIKTAGIS